MEFVRESTTPLLIGLLGVLQAAAVFAGTGLATGEIVSFGSRVTDVTVKWLLSEERFHAAWL